MSRFFKKYNFSFFILIIAFILIFSLTSEAEQDIDEIIEDLQNPEWEIRREAALELRDNKEKAIKAITYLDEAVKDEEYNVSWAAIGALKNIGEKAVPVLIDNLDVDDNRVREDIISAFIELGSKAEEAVKPLSKIVKYEDETELRREAVIALEKIGISSDEVITSLVVAHGDSFRVRRIADRV